MKADGINEKRRKLLPTVVWIMTSKIA